MCKQLMRAIMSVWQAMSLALSLPPLGSLLSMVRPHHLQHHLTTALTAVLSHCPHSSELSLVPTAVVHPGGVVMVAEGSDLTLNCSASGRPTPATYWLRDGQLLGESPRLSLHRLPGSSLLVVRSVSTADGGTYLCYGNNSVGTDTETVAVTVLVRPTLSVVPSNVTARAGEGVNQSVVCEAQGVPPPVVVILDPQGGIVAESGVWTPPTPLTRDISGTYQCVATNQVGQVNVSFSFLVEGELGAQGVSEWEAEMSQHLPSLCCPDVPVITTAPQNITQFIGEEVVLRCVAEGLPPPQVVWSRLDNASLPSNHELVGNNLQLHSLSMQDSGGYRCTAANTLGTDVAITWLSVVGESGGGSWKGKRNFPSCLLSIPNDSFSP